MKKETTPKKVWQKPEVQDLDVKNTASGNDSFTFEKTSETPIWNSIFAPSAS